AKLTKARLAFKRLQNRFAVKRIETYIAAENRRLTAAKRQPARPGESKRTATSRRKKVVEVSNASEDNIPTGEIDLYSVRSGQFIQATLAAKGYTVKLAKVSGGISIASEWPRRTPPLRAPQNDIRSLATALFTPRGEVVSIIFTKLLRQNWLHITD